MNLEYLCKVLWQNYDRLPHRQLTLDVLAYQFRLLAWHRKKLKLGAIVFEIKEVKAYEFVLWEDIDIRFIRQDTTKADANKLENILKRWAWKWDFYNVLAFILVASLFLLLAYAGLYCWYCNNFPAFAFRNKKFDILVKFTLQLLVPHCFSRSIFFRRWVSWNVWINNILIEYCLTFDFFI